ncbi:hypothetical protein [Streptomyces botrytidirepellens]|uniref:hypothetical protein n=1 Tax=Streptomyces botrytidirepellens TaxID=2486417 RepID=UPI0011CE43E2|nr:hypothetical protein [Streptomyces botrytidirepellens]
MSHFSRVFTLTAAAASATLIGGMVPAAASTSPALASRSLHRHCKFYQAADKAHYKDRENAVSGHGWWMNVDCPRGVKAVVTLQLQVKIQNKWKNRGDPKKRALKSGRSKSTNVRLKCHSHRNTVWRGMVDVDLIGMPDTPKKGYGYSTKIPCRR